MNANVRNLGTFLLTLFAFLLLFVLFPNSGLFLKNSFRGWLAMSVFILPLLMFGVNSAAWYFYQPPHSGRGRRPVRPAYDWQEMVRATWRRVLIPIILTGILLAYHYMCGSHSVPYTGFTPCS